MAPLQGTEHLPSAPARGIAATNAAAESAVASAFPRVATLPPLAEPAQERVGSPAWAFAKRSFDLLFALTALLALLPLLLAIALAIKLDSRGPVFFRQRRLGRDLRRFPVMKFRTMYQDVSPEAHRRYIEQLARAEASDDEGLKKLVDDPRVTRVGRVLRKLSLDEVPQFFNVVAGQMSLIGPRPALDYELEHYEARHFDRFEVRPGLSGLWQVSGRNRLGFREMLDLDAEYVRRYGAGTDLSIFLKTPRAVVSDCA